MEIGFEDIRRELHSGNRVLVLVRHSERRKIDKEDPTFGESVPVTGNGWRLSLDWGRALRGAAAAADVEFRASPLRRTVMTAEGIAEGMGLEGAAVVPDDLIGNGSAFFADRLEVWRQFRDRRFFEKMTAYMADGVAPGFAPIGPAAVAYEEYLLSRFTARLGVFVTHDVFIAAYLHARGVKTDWNPDNWPRFLDAAVIVLEPGGARRVEFLRAGLSPLAVGVAPESSAP